MSRRSARLSTKIATTSTSPSAPPAPSPAKPTPSSPITIAFPTPASFHSWLSSHGTTTPTGIWLQIAKKSSAITTITYDEAIDTALCHGWIDGQRRAHSATHFLQRFTPRRRNSLWSKRNVDKVAVLIAAGKMRPAGQAEVDAAKADGRWGKAYDGPATAKVPADFAAALEANIGARDAFQALGKTQRYPFLHRIATVKREETRRRKIEEFVEMLARGETLR